MPRINLHIHTIASYGALDTEGVIRAAGRESLDVVSITDHDAADSSAELLRLARSRDLPFRVLSGVEIDCTYGGRSIEILGYGFDVDSVKMDRFLRGIQERRRRRMEALLGEVRGRLEGTSLSFSDVEVPGRVTYMRPHVAHELVERNIFESFEESIRYLKGIKSAPLVKPTAEEVCELVTEEGGTAVLAHPWYYHRDGWEDLEAMVRALEGRGLSGLEVFYPYYERELSAPSPLTAADEATIIENLRRIAEKEGLIKTAGTDAHGESLGSFLLEDGLTRWLEKY